MHMRHLELARLRERDKARGSCEVHGVLHCRSCVYVKPVVYETNGLAWYYWLATFAAAYPIGVCFGMLVG